MSGLKLEAGKFYRRQDGLKVGPAIVREHRGMEGPFRVGGWNYDQDGKVSSISDKRPELNLIAEWTDAPTGPVRTVTRSEVVRGEYGRVVVTAAGGTWMRDCFTADELRVSIATLTEIADALEAPTQ